jgi:hypothetical protein
VPPQYPAPGQYPVPGPAPKKRLGLIIGIIAAVVLVLIAIAGVVVYNVYTGLGSDTPRSAANEWFTALKRQDIDRVRALTCAQFRDDIDDANLRDDEVTSVTWNIVAINEIDGEKAVATIDISYMDNGESRSDTVKYSIIKEDGDWKVCGPADEPQN